MDEESVDAAVGNENIVICASLNHQSVRSWLKKNSVRYSLFKSFREFSFLLLIQQSHSFNIIMIFLRSSSLIMNYDDVYIIKIFILGNDLSSLKLVCYRLF
jgi:hypothetical protein